MFNVLKAVIAASNLINVILALPRLMDLYLNISIAFLLFSIIIKHLILIVDVKKMPCSTGKFEPFGRMKVNIILIGKLFELG